MKSIFIAALSVVSLHAQTVLVPQGMKSEFSEIASANPSLKLVGYSDLKDAVSKIKDAEGFIGGPDEAIMNAGGKLRWVHIFSAGIENYVSLPRLKDDSVTITNLKIYQGPEIADHAFALLLGLTRNMAAYHTAQESGDWSKGSGRALPLIELRGKTMLVIGYGGIGLQVAERARAFGMSVMAIDKNDIPLTRTLDASGKPDELNEFLPKADVIVSCVPITPETEGMIGTEQFGKMKDGAYLVNVSRGKVVDTAALVAALESGKLAGAGLDVVDPEPLPASSPLWKMENVIITPHVAGVSDARGDRQNELISDNLGRFAKGIPLKNRVSAKAGY